jgi:hypothetical protein
MSEAPEQTGECSNLAELQENNTDCVENIMLKVLPSVFVAKGTCLPTHLFRLNIAILRQ